MARERLTQEQQDRWNFIRGLFINNPNMAGTVAHGELQRFAESLGSANRSNQDACRNIVLAAILFADQELLRHLSSIRGYAEDLRDFMRSNSSIMMHALHQGKDVVEFGAARMEAVGVLISMVKSIEPAVDTALDSRELTQYSILLEQIAIQCEHAATYANDTEIKEQWIDLLASLLTIRMFKDSAGPLDHFGHQECFGTMILRRLCAEQDLGDAIKKHAITVFKQRGCNLDADTGSGCGDLLYCLIHDGRVDLVEYLLQAEVRVQSCNYAGPGTSMTPFQWFFPHQERRLENTPLQLLKLKNLAAQYDPEHFALEDGQLTIKELPHSDHSYERLGFGKPIMIGTGVGFAGGAIIGGAGEAIAQSYGTSALSQILSDLSPELRIVVVAVGGAVIGAILGAIGGTAYSRCSCG